MKRIWKALAVVMSVICGLCMLPLYGAAETAIPEGMVQMAVSDGTVLYCNEKDGTFAVAKEGEGQIWYSNPIDRESDPIASGAAKTMLSAQLNIRYFTNKNENKVMDSYNDCVANEGLKIEKIDGGYRATYQFGRNKITKEMIPNVLSPERYEELLAKIPEGINRETCEKLYKKQNTAELSQSQKQDLDTRFPGLAEGEYYILSKFIADYEIEEIYDGLSIAGYTSEDLRADNEAHGLSVTVVENERIVIPMTVYLDNGDLMVEIDCGAIQVPSNLALTEVTVLPYWGAAGTQDTGYSFLPDGSGSLVQHNNGKSIFTMSVPLYGRDYGNREEEIRSYPYQATMPVFGIVKNAQAMFAIIESGDAHAAINAQTSGQAHSYNTVSATYTIRPWDTVSLDGSNTESSLTNVYQETPFTGLIRMRCHFLGESDADYSGMARYYQNYLEEKGILKRLSDNRYPFLLETLGAFRKKKSFLGIPYTGTVVLTSFEETMDIMGQLEDLGVTDIDVKLDGWFNKGLNNSMPSKISPVSALGGTKDLKDLYTKVSEAGGRLYLDTSMQLVNEPALSFRFNSFTDSIRYAFKEIALVYPYSYSSFTPNRRWSPQFLLAPTKLQRLLQKFEQSRQALGFGVPFYNDMHMLYTNFHASSLTDRQDSLNLVSQALSEASLPGYGIKAGPVYTLENAGLITDVPVVSNRNFLEDQNVPFVQMVLHGYVSYAGEAINMADDYQTALLKTIETGSQFYFIWNYKNSVELKDTQYQDYCSTFYESWLTLGAEAYNKAKDHMASVQNARIIRHTQLAPDVTLTQYDNGISAVVNYGREAFEYKGISVPQRDYAFIEEGLM